MTNPIPTKRSVQASHFWQTPFFDIFFGMIAPILCLLFDPIVFRGDPLTVPSLLGSYRVLGYVSIGLGILVFILWFSVRDAPPWWHSWFAGILLFAGISAYALGLTLLPFSALGLIFFGLGAFGFIPFATGSVYMRHGLRALASITQVSSIFGRIMFMAAMGFGLIMILTVPLVAQQQTSQFVAQNVSLVLSGNPQGVPRLKQAFWCMQECYGAIIQAYRRKPSPALAQAYWELTGQPIDMALGSD